MRTHLRAVVEPRFEAVLIQRLIFILVFSVSAVVAAAFDDKAFSEAINLREQGEFEKATRAFQQILEQTTPTLEGQDRRTVEFEIERIARIRQDYKLTKEKLLQQLRRKLTSLSDEEFDRYEREGKFDIQVIDGQKRYVNSSASNLVLRVPELRDRLQKREPDTMYRRLYNEMLKAHAAQAITSSSLVCPQDIQVTYTVVVEPNAAPEGKTIRCWLPFARSYPHQSDIYLLQTTPAQHVIAPPEAPHRTVYCEAVAVKDKPTTFAARFVYRSWSRVNEINPALVQPVKDAPCAAYYSAERKPHIDFGNDVLKKLSGEIVGGETNPYLAARRIYEWIGNNTIYQYAREYSTLDNISYYTAARRAGDCGQHGMLFIALCRLNGIPARWTTGWECFSKLGNNMHDWCEFYVEPYGWLPADPDIAVNLLKHVDDELTTTQSREVADWLFGNMDGLRLTVNSDFSAPLFPPKTDFRSETVDFQRGEVEADGHNLYFDKWDYTMEMQPIPSEQATALVSLLASPPPVPLLDVTGTYRVEKQAAQTSATADAISTSTESTSSTDAARTAPTSAAGGETSVPVLAVPDTSTSAAAVVANHEAVTTSTAQTTAPVEQKQN